jgi:hypothetical protein
MTGTTTSNSASVANRPPSIQPQTSERGERVAPVANPFMMPGERHNLSAYERNRLFLNHRGDQFVDASFTSNADLDSDSRSAMPGDFNNDGATDLLVASVGGGPLRLFLNQIGVRSNSVSIQLSGTTANKTAIGSRIIASVADRSIVRDVFPANGFMGQAPVQTLIGIGDADMIEQLKVRWPTGVTQIFHNIPAGSQVSITEGVAAPSIR